jgi:mono/diheme cytochrome c family protein
MRRTTALALAVVLPGLLAALLAPTGAQAGAPDGKALFLAQKCNLCHSIDAAAIARVSKAEKTKGPDLGGVAKRHDAAWMKRFLTKQEELNGKKHLKAFTGTPQELDALIAWLLTQ